MSWYDPPEEHMTEADYYEQEHSGCNGCPQCDSAWFDAPAWTEGEYQKWAAMHPGAA